MFQTSQNGIGWPYFHILSAVKKKFPLIAAFKIPLVKSVQSTITPSSDLWGRGPAKLGIEGAIA
jgi:hypothetical protein